MTSNNISAAIAYYQSHYDDLFSQFKTLLRIPSISASEEAKGDVQKAANFIVDKLKSIGLNNVKAYQTPRHPLIYADYLVNPEKPTVLIYGHYDVQPPDPLDEWETPPFEPTIRDDYLFARGASDMKGQVWANISALESILKTSDLAVNIKILFEGEEEIGSPSLDPFLEEYKDMLKCDLVLNTDADMLSPNQPTIIYALRGLAYFELRIYGPNADLHSGIFGGVVDNPANVLAKLIAGMHDENGTITLPGFYDKVRKISPRKVKNSPASA